MGLIDHAHDHIGFAGIVFHQLAPQTGKLIVRRPALPNNGTVPTSVVVDIDDTVRAGHQARFDKSIVLGEIGAV